jgi:molecular chaperone GrpE
MMRDDPETGASDGEHEAEISTAEATDPISALEEERDRFKALAQRAQADFVNFKRRTEQERGMVARSASNQIVARLLPILDDLQRAVEALPADSGSWGEGVTMIQQNLRALVETEGVTSYEPAPGDTFDPAEHEAVYYQPTGEQPPGAVLSVVRPGYRSADRVLRPAQVVVAQETETSAEGDPAPA